MWHFYHLSNVVWEKCHNLTVCTNPAPAKVNIQRKWKVDGVIEWTIFTKVNTFLMHNMHLHMMEMDVERKNASNKHSRSDGESFEFVCSVCWNAVSGNDGNKLSCYVNTLFTRCLFCVYMCVFRRYIQPKGYQVHAQYFISLFLFVFVSHIA